MSTAAMLEYGYECSLNSGYKESCLNFYQLYKQEYMYFWYWYIKFYKPCPCHIGNSIKRNNVNMVKGLLTKTNSHNLNLIKKYSFANSLSHFYSWIGWEHVLVLWFIFSTFYKIENSIKQPWITIKSIFYTLNVTSCNTEIQIRENRKY